MGAGWKQAEYEAAEYEAYGIPFPSVKERVDRLEEALNIILKLWTEPKVTFEGKYYQVKGAFRIMFSACFHMVSSCWNRQLQLALIL